MNPKWMPTHLGAEPKKVAMLAGLVALLGVVYWMNSSPSAPAPTPAARPTTAAGTPPPVAAAKRIPSPEVPLARRRAKANSAPGIGDDFRPTLKLPEGTDVSIIDPALRVDLLAKAQSDASAGGRSLFEFSQAPPPPPPKVSPIKPAPVQPAEPPKTVAVSAEPPKPPPPPAITLKYYGFAGNASSGQRRAFFLDGEDIFVAGENDLVKGRYRIVRIGVNSAVVEDVPNKNQQTLPLVEELAG
jgi:hypothetical protein